MSAPDVYDVDIDDLDLSGDGLARHARGHLAVPFTIPGERVRIRVTVRGPSVRAALVSVLRPSPHRVEPRCVHFGPNAEPGVGPCGGCSWQHIAYPEQLRIKSGFVERLVRAAVRGAPPVSPARAATPLDQPWGYRRKVHFVFGNTSPRPDSLVMGHYVRGTRRVIPVRECPVHDPRGNAVAFEFEDSCLRAGVRAADGTGVGTLRHIAVRVGASGETMATVVASDASDPRLRKATRALNDGKAAPTSLHLNLHHRDDGYIFGRETRKVGGRERLKDVVAGTSFLVSPTSFFQTNVDAAAMLVEIALDAIPPGSRVLDLYAGAGLFAIPLALRGDTVLAVEENRAAVADGVASAKFNGLAPDTCRFVAQRAGTALSAIRTGAYDAVVLDPPRDGCEPHVIDTLFGDIAPETAVYVSCNPEALAHDLARIVRHGYRILSLQPVDMFPHTPHVETIATLARA